MTTVAIALAAWTALSLPVGVLVGRWLGSRDV